MMLPLMEVLYVPLFVGALGVAWYVEAGVPTLVAFLLLLYRLQPHIKGVDQDRVRLAGLASSVADVAAVMADAGGPAPTGGRPFAGLERDIAFEGVSFRYAQSSRSALDGVTARIRRGEVTALVGASGSGKSTMINLLYRFYDPEAGRILVDGVPLTDLDLAAWRGRLALAGQDAELFAGSIHDNIAYGRPQASRAEVEEAARLADAEAFIAALPEGYDTPIGSRGMKLSGGQRQRIGLARALLRRPDVLVLDEATNALDGISEQSIQEVLGLLAGATTIIIIAHRLSTIRHADHVIVLEGGRLAEDGPPPTLVAAGGVFARLYDLKAVGGV
jgi:subfamily B ATP-binding cassette protein MsbA